MKEKKRKQLAMARNSWCNTAGRRGDRQIVSSIAGTPEGDNVYHEPEWMAPHFQRTPIKEPDFIIEKKNFSKRGFHLDKEMENLRTYEILYKRLKPWSRLMHRLRY